MCYVLGYCGLASAVNKEPCGCCITPPSSPGDGEQIQKQKAKLVGCDKNNFTEQQREKKIKIIILIRRIYSMQCSYRPMLSLLLSSKSPSFSQLPHLNTEQDITWYRISHLTGWFGSAQVASCGKLTLSQLNTGHHRLIPS